LKKESLDDDLRILDLKKKKMIAIMSYIKNVKKHQDISVTKEVSDYLQKSSVLDVNVLILDYWKLMKNLKSAMTQFIKDILAISAADIEVKYLFNMNQDVITYH